MQRIAVFALTLALAAVAAVPQGNAQSYPERPIRLIIGFPPGSAADITARLVGDAMSRTLGQQIVVEARPGAGSSIAAEFVARSPADGYTLFIGTLSNVTNAVTSSNLRFDFVKDFAPIAPLTGLPLILAVHPSLGVSSVKELFALAKSKPGELTYGSVGPGTVGHLAMELLSVRTNIKLVHVPYQGSPPQVTDLVAGRTVDGVGGGLDGHAARRSRPSHGARLGLGQAPAHRAEHPDHRRDLAARFRLHRVVRPDGARRHAARGDREAFRRRPSGAASRRRWPASSRRQASSRSTARPRSSPRLIARGMVTWAAAAEAAGLRK